MEEVLLLFILVVGVVVLTAVADVVRVPQPILMTLFGLGVALTPVSPELHIDPHLILPVVLPPLLFAATQRTTAREFRDHAGAVFVLAVGLTLASMAAAAVVAHAFGLPWVAAFVLGAIVSPPDPVAATAVARRLRLPHRIVTVLEGEGMFNDATALVAFKVALLAAVTGSVTFGGVVLELVLAVTCGVLVGLLLGWLTNRALAAVHDAYAETTITVLAPFLSYVLAEQVNGSGVLAVLVMGLYLRSYGHEGTTSQGWLLGRAVWSYADFLISSLVFALVGFELVKVIEDTPVTARTATLAVSVIMCLVILRAAWVFASVAAKGRHRARRPEGWPVGWRESTVVSWAGMRGVVSVAAALAIPRVVEGGDPFPARNEIVVVALLTVLATLVVQGLSLGPLTQRLRVSRTDDDTQEVAKLREVAARAALEDLRNGPLDNIPAVVRRAATAQYEGYLTAQAAIEEAKRPDQEAAEGEQDEAAASLRKVLQRATDVERAVVLEARRRGRVSPASADEVLRDIEGRVLRDF